jgi:lipopolysaccharide transport system permease protein
MFFKDHDLNKRYIDIIIFRTYSFLKADATRGYLGALWWVIEPILYMVAFYLVFAIGLRSGGDNYIQFLLVGLTAWKWFASNIQQGSNAIEANVPILRQVYVPKYIFLYSVVLTNTVKHLIVLILLILFILISGYEVTNAWLALPVVMIFQLLFIIGVGGILSAIIPLIPDLKMLVDNILLFGLFISGIFFDINSFSPSVQTYFKMNPMAVFIINYRKIFLDGEWPVWSELMLINVLSITLISLSFHLFHKFDRHYLKISY